MRGRDKIIIFDHAVSDIRSFKKIKIKIIDRILSDLVRSLVTASLSVSPPGIVPSTSVVKETATGTPIFLAALTTPIASSE